MSYAEKNNYDKLSKFTSVKEFNDHFEQVMIDLKSEFTKAEYIALNELRKFAGGDIPGVAWCKGQKAVAATHQKMMFGISRASFDRMLRKAKKFNLITVINQFHKNGYKKHNLYIFNRLEDVKSPSEVVEIVSVSNTIAECENEKTAKTESKIPSDLPLEKQVKDIYKENPLCDLEKELEDQKQNKTAFMNDFQKALFNLMNDMPLVDDVKDELHKMILAAEINTRREMLKAKDVIFKIAKDLAEGTLTVKNTLRSIFKVAYNKALDCVTPKEKAVTNDSEQDHKVVPFYNWLEDRDGSANEYVSTRPTKDNWLLW